MDILFWIQVEFNCYRRKYTGTVLSKIKFIFMIKCVTIILHACRRVTIILQARKCVTIIHKKMNLSLMRDVLQFTWIIHTENNSGDLCVKTHVLHWF